MGRTLAGIWFVMMLVLPACASPNHSALERETTIAQRVAATVDPIIEADLAATGAPGAAFVFVQGGRIVYERGYGVSDLATRAVVDPERTVWPIASITKVVTAMAVLQLVDQRRVDLDTDVNRYLTRLQVPSQGYPPITLRHLLSHTAGLDELPGRQTDGREAPDLAAFLNGRLVRYRAPGRLTSYSTYGIMLAAVALEDVTGQSYEDYVAQHIFAPAGMASGKIMRVRGDEIGVATPYAEVDGRIEARPYEWYASRPTSSAAATAADMGRLLIAHLSRARTNGARLLSPRTMALMHTQQATIHPDLPGWSLGMQMDRVNGRSIAEHGGDIGGFSALFVVIPEEDAGFFIVSHGEGGDLRFRVKQALMDALFPARRAPVIPARTPENTAALGEYAGRYVSSVACHSCGEDLAADAFVVEATDGALSLWGQTWLPLRRDLFIRDDGKRLLGFARDDAGSIIAVSGGSWRVADRLEAVQHSAPRR